MAYGQSWSSPLPLFPSREGRDDDAVEGGEVDDGAEVEGGGVDHDG